MIDMEKYTVDVKRIIWLDKESLEAEVKFEINGKEMYAFCHPCKLAKIGNEVVTFNILEENISDSSFLEGNPEKRKGMVPDNGSKWRYYCYGQITSIHPVWVDCGDIKFTLGDWINDERVIGSFVYFVISRLDIAPLE